MLLRANEHVPQGGATSETFFCAHCLSASIGKFNSDTTLSLAHRPCNLRRLRLWYSCLFQQEVYGVHKDQNHAGYVENRRRSSKVRYRMPATSPMMISAKVIQTAARQRSAFFFLRCDSLDRSQTYALQGKQYNCSTLYFHHRICLQFDHQRSQSASSQCCSCMMSSSAASNSLVMAT